MAVNCAYCAKVTDELHRDHVVPRSRGGSDNATNIVMACADCNRDKRDQLPSEWLGDRCPSSVLMIEIREHDRLKKDFSGKRDRRSKAPEPAPSLYAFTLHENGSVGYVGVVLSETPTTVRVEAVDALNFFCGLWDLSGAIYDVPREQCRIYNDRDCMIRKVHQLYKAWEFKQQVEVGK